MKLLALADLGRAGIHVVVVVGNLGKSSQCQAPPPCSMFSLPPSCRLLLAALLAFFPGPHFFISFLPPPSRPPEPLALPPSFGHSY